MSVVSQHEQELFVTDLELSDHQILSCTLCPIQGFQVCVWDGGQAWFWGSIHAQWNVSYSRSSWVQVSVKLGHRQLQWLSEISLPPRLWGYSAAMKHSQVNCVSARTGTLKGAAIVHKDRRIVVTCLDSQWEMLILGIYKNKDKPQAGRKHLQKSYLMDCFPKYAKNS